MKNRFPIILAILLASCSVPVDTTPYTDVEEAVVQADTTLKAPVPLDSGRWANTGPAVPARDSLPLGYIDTKNVPPAQIVAFAKSMLGTPYKYASSDPRVGFDCSGFITYVYSHFGINVPRSSVDFTNVGRPVPTSQAKPGDLILFTGTDSSVRVVGHMGIVMDNSDSLRFIHSSSGRANGVTVTPLNDYYRGRFVKVIDIDG